MIGRDDIDKLRRFLKYSAVKDPFEPDWYSVNGLEIYIEGNCVYVYLTRDQWLVACTTPGGAGLNNPHKVIILDFDRLIRLIKGGEMLYNNIENEIALEELR